MNTDKNDKVLAAKIRAGQANHAFIAAEADIAWEEWRTLMNRAFEFPCVKTFRPAVEAFDRFEALLLQL
jgi:hypothetical protein